VDLERIFAKKSKSGHLGDRVRKGPAGRGGALILFGKIECGDLQSDVAEGLLEFLRILRIVDMIFRSSTLGKRFFRGAAAGELKAYRVDGNALVLHCST